MVARTWSEAARGWERWEPYLLQSLSAVDPYLIRALDPRPGNRVLDFGCGIGEPALSLAPWVGPRGSVLGVDLARPMIEVARRRARSRGLKNVRFRVGDITRLPMSEGKFDRVVARYGVMFQEHTEAFLRALHSRIKPGGRIALAVWGPRNRNAMFEITARVALPYLEQAPADPENSPHALRFGRPGRLAGLLRKAGFLGVTSLGVPAPMVSGTPELAARIICETSGSTRTMMARLSKKDCKAFVASLTRELARHADGPLVRLPRFAWVVSGRR